MTTPDPKQLADARNFADDARALSDVAQHFKEALLAHAAQQPPRPGLSISVADSRTKSERNFRLITTHGEVEALFDHAFHFGALVGRYRFFLLAHMPAGDIESREIWQLLFNENYSATWEPNEDLRGHCTPGHRDGSTDSGRLVQILLVQIQAVVQVIAKEASAL